MESAIKQISRSVYAVIGAEGSTNFGIVKGSDNSAALIDADIRRIDEIEEALKLTGCSKVSYLIDTHEHFDHTSGNFYFAQRDIPNRRKRGLRRCHAQRGRTGFRAHDEAGARALRALPRPLLDVA